MHLLDATPEGLECLKTRLDDYEVTLLINRRSPEDWLKSFHQQIIVNPVNPKFPHYASDITETDFAKLPFVQLLSDPDALARKAMKAYGAKDVVFSDLENQWPKTLTELLGVPHLEDSVKDTRLQNKGLSGEATELMRQINGFSVPQGVRMMLLWRLRLCDYANSADDAASAIRRPAVPKIAKLSLSHKLDFKSAVQGLSADDPRVENILMKLNVALIDEIKEIDRCL